MKKKVALLLAFLMLTSMVACETTVREEPPTTVPDTEASPEVTPEPEDLAYNYNKEPKSDFVSYGSYYVYDNKYKPETSELLVSSFYYDIEIKSDHPALAKAVEEWNKKNMESMGSATESYYEDALQYCDDEYFMGAYANEETLTVRRADSKVFSIAYSDYTYMGGAHPCMYVGGENFDVETGNTITLGDVFSDEDALVKAMVDELDAKYETEYFFYVDDPETGNLADYIKKWFKNDAGKLSVPFYMTYDGVVFNFGEYGLDAYAGGSQSITLTYEKYGNIMNEKYAKDVPTDYATELWPNYENEEVATDFYISLENYNYEDGDDGYPTTLAVVKGDKREELNGLELGRIQPFYVCKGGKKFVIINAEHYYAYWTEFYIFDVTDETPKFVRAYDGAVQYATDPDAIKVNYLTDMLSTYTVYAYYTIESDGNLAKLSDYDIALPFKEIVSNVELTGDCVDYDTLVKTGESVTFPAGTSFTIIATDCNSVVILESSDGVRALFDTNPEWPQTIEGLNAEDTFDGLIYAG